MGQSFVVWDDRYSIGVDVVDEQHKGLFNLTNDLHDACGGSNEAAKEHFKEVLQKAVGYVSLHFSTEENIMQKTNDPGYGEHKKEHDLFVQKVLAEAANLDKGGNDAPRVFVNFLRDWISKHVTGTDVGIGRHVAGLKARGLLKSDAIF